MADFFTFIAPNVIFSKDQGAVLAYFTEHKLYVQVASNPWTKDINQLLQMVMDGDAPRSIPNVPFEQVHSLKNPASHLNNGYMSLFMKPEYKSKAGC